MLEATTRIKKSPKGRTGVMFLPSVLVCDSNFPFTLPAEVRVKIEGNKLLIEKV